MPRSARIPPFLALLGALLLAGPASHAQFSPYENINVAPYGILPLLRMLQLGGSIVSNSVDFFYFDQSWDAGIKHYRSRLPGYFYCPELPAAGHFSFRLQQKSGEGQLWGLNEETDIRSFIREKDKDFDGDLARLSRKRYHYDKSGWLVAVTEVSMAPASDYFAEITDSFRYEGGPGQLSGIQWLHKEYKTGRHFASSVYCDTTPPFQHLRKRSEVYLRFDGYQNLTDIDSRSAEQWDDCDNGGPGHWHRSIRYDGLGRVVRIADSSESMTGISSEYLFEYREEEAGDFMRRVAADPLYAPFRDTAVARFLAGQGPLRYLAFRKTAKSYTRYDDKQHRHVLSGGPPVVQTDSSFFLLDEKRERVAHWESKPKETGSGYITFYTRLYDSSAQARYKAQRTIGRPALATPRSLVEEPYRAVLSGFEVWRYDTAARENFSLIRFSTGRSVEEGQPGYPASPKRGAATSEDERRIRGAAFSPPGAAALLDSKGLVRYIWLPYTTYKLSYE